MKKIFAIASTFLVVFLLSLSISAQTNQQEEPFFDTGIATKEFENIKKLFYPQPEHVSKLDQGVERLKVLKNR